MENKKFIRIRGAAENNLKHIDLDIPRDELVVLTGFAFILCKTIFSPDGKAKC